MKTLTNHLKNTLWVLLILLGMGMNCEVGWGNGEADASVGSHADPKVAAAIDGQLGPDYTQEPGERQAQVEEATRALAESAPMTPDALTADTRSNEEKEAAIRAALDYPDLSEEDTKALTKNLKTLMDLERTRKSEEELATEVASLEEAAGKPGASPLAKAEAAALLGVLQARLEKEKNLDRAVAAATTSKGKADKSEATPGDKVLARERRERALALSREAEGKAAAERKTNVADVTRASTIKQAANDAVTIPAKPGESPTLRPVNEEIPRPGGGRSAPGAPPSPETRLARAAQRLRAGVELASAAGDIDTEYRLAGLAGRLEDAAAGKLGPDQRKALAQDLANEVENQTKAQETAQRQYDRANEQASKAQQNTANRAAALRPAAPAAAPAAPTTTTAPAPTPPTTAPAPAPAVSTPAVSSPVPLPTVPGRITAINGTPVPENFGKIFSLPNGNQAYVVPGKQVEYSDRTDAVVALRTPAGVGIGDFSVRDLGLVAEGGELSIAPTIPQTAVTDNGTTSVVPVVYKDGKAYPRVQSNDRTYWTNSEGSIVTTPTQGGPVTPLAGSLPSGIVRTTTGLAVINGRGELPSIKEFSRDPKATVDSVGFPAEVPGNVKDYKTFWESIPVSVLSPAAPVSGPAEAGRSVPTASSPQSSSGASRKTTRYRTVCLGGGMCIRVPINESR